MGMEDNGADHQQRDRQECQHRRGAEAGWGTCLRLHPAALLVIERDTRRGRNRNGCTKHAHKILLGSFAIRAQAVELQPVLFDLESGLVGDSIEQGGQVVALEQAGFAALRTQDQVLMSLPGG